MPKILSQSGISLSDVYDVEGSIAGIDELVSKDVSLIHEMGAAIHSERLVAQIHRVTTGALAQNATWDLVTATFQPVPARIVGCIAICNSPARIDHCTISVRDPNSERDIPIFAFDDQAAVDAVKIRVQENTGAVIATNALIPSLLTIPSMIFGRPKTTGAVNEIAFRGLTTAFGAGTVATIMLLFFANAEQQGVSSHGLPLPSW